MFTTLSKLCTAAFVLTMFWTQTIGPLAIGVSGRLVPADFFGAGAIVFWICDSFQGRIRIPVFLQAFACLVLALLLGCVTSLEQSQTLIEILILCFLAVLCLAIVNTFTGLIDLLNLMSLLAAGLIVASAVGAWELFGPGLGLGSIVRDSPTAEVGIGGFRNSGQAGAYCLIVLTVLIPLRFSRLYGQLELWRRYLVTCSVVMGLLFLVSTVKIAAYIGLAVALGLYLVLSLVNRRWRNWIAVALVVACVGVAYEGLIRFQLKWNGWLEYKAETRSAELGGEGFLADNLSAAVQAFNDRPLFGTGIGAFEGHYGEYEVHSTYFKMLGEAGMTGLACYCLFMACFMRMFWQLGRVEGVHANFLRQMIPFVIGCLVSWGYTYHLRKREFWIMISVIWLARRLAGRQPGLGRSPMRVQFHKAGRNAVQGLGRPCHPVVSET